jgi:hypothetical protein
METNLNSCAYKAGIERLSPPSNALTERRLTALCTLKRHALTGCFGQASVHQRHARARYSATGNRRMPNTTKQIEPTANAMSMAV